MDLSVIICTFNRAWSLRRTLRSFCNSQLLNTTDWELLVVDNHSTDETPAVVKQFTDSLPIRYVVEPKQGLSQARNRGIGEAKGQLLLFTDDDVEIAANWLAAYQQAAIRHPDAVYFAGRILPRWESEPPGWLARNSVNVLRGVTVHFDLGDIERPLAHNSHESPFGANMGFRAGVFHDTDGARFPVDVGTCGYDELLRGDETAVFDNLQQRGEKGIYVPSALLHHCLPAERMTRSYVRRWFRDNGRSRVLFGRCPASLPDAYWQYAYNHLRYVVCRWTLPSNVWLRAERNRAVAAGMICELRKKKNGARGES